MIYLKYILFVISIFLFASWKQSDKVKRIGLYKNQASIEVPSIWKYKEKYREYSNYQIKYDIRVSDAKTESVLTVDVYDSSHMYNTPITDELLDSFKEVQFKTKGQSVKFIEREVVKIDNHDVGL
jgi:hypothetical protein